jgi:hypothetical protein
MGNQALLFDGLGNNTFTVETNVSLWITIRDIFLPTTSK